MTWIKTIFGLLLLVGAIFGWVYIQKKFRGDDTPMFNRRKRKEPKEDGNDLEAFIAAYRSGKVDPAELAGDARLPAGSAAAVTMATVVQTAAQGSAGAKAAAPSVAPAAPAAPRPGALLRPEVKLAYLTFRTGMRDHHVFPNVRLNDLGHGVAVGTIDLLVCDGSFKYVAAIDIYVGEQPNDTPKQLFLNRAGIKHLYLPGAKMPRPNDLKDLIYGSGA